MKIKLILFMIVVIGALSCSESDPTPAHFGNIDSVSVKYMITREQHSEGPVVGGNAHFQYSKGKFLKRTGGYLAISVGAVYTKDVYDSVQYPDGKTIIITTHDNFEELTLFPHTREITLENKLIKSKITVARDPLYNDTIYYFYNSQKRIQRTEQRFAWRIITREYFFDGAGNLERITGTEKSRLDDTLYYTSEELFGGYDDTPNPLKGLCLWEDLYYRSLSNNNFTTYSYKKKSGDNEETESVTATWALVYNQNGRVDYSK